MPVPPTSLLTTEDELRRHYGEPHPHLWLKQIDHIDRYGRQLIAASPFLVIATTGPGGVDCSPKGDVPGFVQVQDDHTLLIPDRAGNRRLDGLRNIIADPRVGLIFMIPGMNASFRVNGRATISVDEALCERCGLDGRKAMSVIVVAVEEAFIHCGRAMLKAGLWNPGRHVAESDMPSLQEIFAHHLALSQAAEA